MDINFVTHVRARPPWMAVFADMGASLLVVANGLRLLKAGVQGR